MEELGLKNAGVADQSILRVATEDGRAVITYDREDFRAIHRRDPEHAGILACTSDRDFDRLAQNIDRAIAQHAPLAGKFILVVRGG